MFEHLDDPKGLGSVNAMRDEVARTGRRRRRARRLAWGGTAAVAVVGATAIAAYAYVDRKTDRIDRVEVAGLAPEPDGDEPYVVLFRGLDDASGLAEGDQITVGREEVLGERADTLLLARIDPTEETVTVLSLPRDLLVTGPDGVDGRINQLDRDATVAAIHDDLGIDVHRVVETDLAGAIAIGDSLGGLRLYFSFPTRDLRAGFATDAGCRSLSGSDALALARSRHLEQADDDGTWHVDPSGDLGRIVRQQDILVAAVAAFSHLDLTSPSAVDGFLDAIGDHVTVDAEVSKADLLDLFRDVAGSEIGRIELPVTEEVVDGASVLVLDDDRDRATHAIEWFRSGDLPLYDYDPQHRGLPSDASHALGGLIGVGPC